jgi:hypothetical protein
MADVFYLYAMAVNKTIDKYGVGQILNGSIIRAYSSRLSFNGILFIYLFVFY